VTPDAAAASPSPLPRSRPAEAESQSTESIKVPTGAAAASASAGHGSQGRTVAPAATVRNDPLANLIISSQRVAAVQRALTDYGYGQIKPTGTVNSDTQAAIQKFERERKLPITGQVSERLVHELGAATGRTIE
jgi:peptidoglycan hydrolase-like protein with peptidoglycan-binding domain